MVSPARRHYQKTMAAQAAGQSEPEQVQTGDTYALMSAALVEDRRRLHDIQSIERKIELKRELLPQYQPYIDGVLSEGVGAQDDVLMVLMIWHLDVGDLDRATEIARYALQHDLTPPDTYKRSTATIIAEESSDQVLREVPEDPDTATRLLQLMSELTTMTEPHDMPDQVRAKQFKAIGYLHRALGNPESLEPALNALKRALDLDERVGVKKDIERLEREIKNSAQQGS